LPTPDDAVERRKGKFLENRRIKVCGCPKRTGLKCCCDGYCPQSFRSKDGQPRWVRCKRVDGLNLSKSSLRLSKAAPPKLDVEQLKRRVSYALDAAHPMCAAPVQGGCDTRDTVRFDQSSVDPGFAAAWGLRNRRPVRSE
jgi:hypothetical protein